MQRLWRLMRRRKPQLDSTSVDWPQGFDGRSEEPDSLSDSQFSQACTEDMTSSLEGGQHPAELRLEATDESFLLAVDEPPSGMPGAGDWQLPVLLHTPSGAVRLALASLEGKPAPESGILYMGVNRGLRYRPFCADFGPFNLGI